LVGGDLPLRRVGRGEISPLEELVGGDLLPSSSQRLTVYLFFYKIKMSIARRWKEVVR
jgi:hypothetical protein